MRFYDALLKKYPVPGTPRQQSDLLNEFEAKLFHAFPWTLDLDENEQNEIIEFLFGKWYAWQRDEA